MFAPTERPIAALLLPDGERLLVAPRLEREHAHVGHGLGQRIHQSPFLDVGGDRAIEPGMVLSVEPGLYVPGLGGFRHSDTVVVTEDGIEMLTDYPRDLASLTLPAT